MDIDYNDVSFEKAINEKPELHNDQICLSATVDQNSELILDVDKTYRKQVGLAPGKYYSVYKIVDYTRESCPIENQEPKVASDQKIIEGSIWVDKYTGEAKFDPKKNRDDHRHHAIDAIVIALTEQSYLQHLSTYNAQQKAWQRGKIDSTEKFPFPWSGFINDVHKKADQILISHKKHNKVLTKNKKGFSVRGQLHEDTLYGKNTNCATKEYTTRVPIHKLKFQRTKGQAKYLHDILDAGVFAAIIDKIKENLEKDEVLILEEITKNEQKLANISNNRQYKLAVQEIEKLKRNISVKVEKSLQEDTFFLKNVGKRYKKIGKCSNGCERSPVPIKKVKIKFKMSNAALLKEFHNTRNNVSAQYVNPGSNHHVVIYEDFDGNLKEDVVQFWTVVERQMNGEDIYKLPHDGKKIITTLEINDMFVLGLSDEEFEDNKDNGSILSKHLYRVQKVSSMYYTFRYHLASTINNKNEEEYVQSMAAWQKLNPRKLKIDELGSIIMK